MAKLNQKRAATAKRAASENPFALLPDGYYKAKLIKVENGKSKKQDPMWTWFFKVNGKDLREYTVLTDAALWKVGQIFEAFGAPTDTDTEDLHGKEIVVEIGSEMFEGTKGNREVNRIVGYPDQNVPVGPFEAEAAEDADDDKPEETAAEDEPDF